jgi:hypothetical protein
MKRLWVVRIAVGGNDLGTEDWFDNPFLECLRYAGIVRVHGPTTPSDGKVFDIFPPKARWADSKEWAEQNAARIRTFGLNAAAAPST